MAVSIGASQKIAFILIEEIGRDKAAGLVRRLLDEVKGNKSFQESLLSVERELLVNYPVRVSRI